MTIAACYHCGEWKYGALTECPACAAVPCDEDDIMVSMILIHKPESRSDAELQRRIDIIKSGRKIIIEEPAASQLRKAARECIRMMGPHLTGSADSKPTAGQSSQSDNHPSSEEPGNGQQMGRKQSASIAWLFSSALWSLSFLPILIVLAIAALLVAVGLLQTAPSSDWPSFLKQFIPSPYLAVLVSVFLVSRFENQRWTRARASGVRGESEIAGLVVDFSGHIAWTFSKIFLFALLFDFGWQQTLGLFVISQFALICWPAFRGDSLFRWVAGTILVWPLMFLLVRAVTWFGYL